ncbi:MAG: PKD domain-containing protein [Planctomycetes bacterium]|nr:PKD domain-containing protein [Planctomycetota bacterium]
MKEKAIVLGMFVVLASTGTIGCANSERASSKVENLFPEACTRCQQIAALLAEPQMVRFAVRAGDLDGAIDGIKWNFGDSSVSNEMSPIHIYEEPGDYLVSCRVWDDNGVSVTD